MFRNILRAVSKTSASTVAPSTRITIYHNPTSRLSTQLLNKLNNYASLPCTADKFGGSATLTTKFNINVKEEQLSFDDYQFIVDECLDMHPDNRRIASLLFKNGEFTKYCNLSLQDFNKICKINLTKSSLVIDYANKLVANDEATFDRIMANYLSCGIQQSSNGNIRNISEDHIIIKRTETIKPEVKEIKVETASTDYVAVAAAATAAASAAATASTNEFYKYSSLVHPNVAEFADLF